MRHTDIDRMCILDLACKKHCGKQLPVLTLDTIFEYVSYLEALDKLQNLKLPRKPKGPRISSDDDVNIVIKGSRKKKWSHLQYRMRRALRYNI